MTTRRQMFMEAGKRCTLCLRGSEMMEGPCWNNDKRKGPAKVLANGDLSRAVTVRGIKMSAGARTKIEAAGGRVEE